jgi:general secretion pathway protein C
VSVAILLGDTRQSAVKRALPTLATTLCGLWLAWTLVQLLWSFFPPSEPPALTQITPFAPPSAQRTQASGNSASLASYHLFGQTPAGELPSAPDAPETQLKLTLIGTAAGRDPKMGVAVIVDENNRQRAYQVGEIVGQATVDSIYQDRVVLMFQGRLETLFRPKTSTADALLSSRNNASAVIMDQPGSVNVNAIGVDPNAYVNPVAGVSTASFDAVREQVLANPAAMMGMLSPVFDGNGNLEGVKLASGANDPLLQKAGIQASDVIVSVNGARIDSIAKGQEIANNLATANEVLIIVRREGREITLPAVRFR